MCAPPAVAGLGVFPIALSSQWRHAPPPRDGCCVYAIRLIPTSTHLSSLTRVGGCFPVVRASSCTNGTTPLGRRVARASSIPVSHSLGDSAIPVARSNSSSLPSGVAHMYAHLRAIVYSSVDVCRRRYPVRLHARRVAFWYEVHPTQRVIGDRRRRF